MSYQKKNVFEAFQMTLAARRDEGGWPAWVTTAWGLSSSLVGSIHPDPREGGELIIVESSKGTLRITWNDWIVQEGVGDLEVFSPARFTALFEEI